MASMKVIPDGSAPINVDQASVKLQRRNSNVTTLTINELARVKKSDRKLSLRTDSSEEFILQEPRPKATASKLRNEAGKGGVHFAQMDTANANKHKTSPGPNLTKSERLTQDMNASQEKAVSELNWRGLKLEFRNRQAEQHFLEHEERTLYNNPEILRSTGLCLLVVLYISASDLAGVTGWAWDSDSEMSGIYTKRAGWDVGILINLAIMNMLMRQARSRRLGTWLVSTFVGGLLSFVLLEARDLTTHKDFYRQLRLSFGTCGMPPTDSVASAIASGASYDIAPLRLAEGYYLWSFCLGSTTSALALLFCYCEVFKFSWGALSVNCLVACVLTVAKIFVVQGELQHSSPVAIWLAVSVLLGGVVVCVYAFAGEKARRVAWFVAYDLAENVEDGRRHSIKLATLPSGMEGVLKVLDSLAARRQSDVRLQQVMIKLRSGRNLWEADEEVMDEMPQWLQETNRAYMMKKENEAFYEKHFSTRHIAFEKRTDTQWRIGDRVKVVKEQSSQAGKIATVTIPDWAGRIMVKMDEMDGEQAKKSYMADELVKIAEAPAKLNEELHGAMMTELLKDGTTNNKSLRWEMNEGANPTVGARQRPTNGELRRPSLGVAAGGDSNLFDGIDDWGFDVLALTKELKRRMAHTAMVPLTPTARLLGPDDGAKRRPSKLSRQASFTRSECSTSSLKRSKEAAERGPILSVLGLHLYRRHTLQDKLGVPELQLLSFLQKIESIYLQCPYHNAMHGADAMRNIHYFYVASDIGLHLTPLEKFAGLIAGAVHDVQHPGVNNQYLINTEDPLAITYNDTSPLENMHCATAFTIAKSTHLLHEVPLMSRQMLRKQVLAMVMETDLACHFSSLAKFKTQLGNTQKEVGVGAMATASGVASGAGSVGNGPEKRSILERLMVEPETRLVVMQMCMKNADIAHAGKPWALHEVWSKRILEEFFLQGEAEVAKGFTSISSLCDRNETDVFKSQVRLHLFSRLCAKMPFS
jgi:hypothetical protein